MKLFGDCVLQKVDAKEWANLSEFAHMIAFNEERKSDMNTFDYALVASSPSEIHAYATVIEMDKETAYMQHGGTMPNVRGTIRSKQIYHGMIEWLKGRYKRVTTRIHNQNTGMLKLALSEKLLVVGCDCYPDGVFLHLRYEHE